MGLDQKITVKYVENDQALENDYYFRKVNSLQGYMENKYNTQNLEPHLISLDDINVLLKHTEYILKNNTDLDYINEHVPPTQGFFYGSYQIDEWYFEDMENIQNAMKDILSKPNIQEIIYWCWY